MRRIFTPLRTLKSITLLISLFFASSLQAQVVYTDIDPDATETQTTDGTSTYDIDLNNDAQIDFVVSIAQATDAPSEDGSGTVSSIMLYIIPFDNASGASIAVDNTDDENAISFSDGSTIGSTETWDNSFGMLSYDALYTLTGG